MAEQIINLATFEFDTSKLEQNLSSLQDRLFKLKQDQKGMNDAYKEAQREIDQTVKTQQLLIKSGGLQSDAYKQNADRLKELNQIQLENSKGQQAIASQMKVVSAEITRTNKELTAYMTTEGQQASLIDLGNKALATQVTNINQARASNTELLKVRNQLNPAIATEAKLIQDLNARMDANNKFIKTNASEYEKTKINVGNYSESIKEALKESGLLNSATQALPGPLRAAVVGFQQAGTAIKGITSAFGEARAAQQQYATLTTVANEATEASIAATERATQIGFQFGAGKATQTEVEAANTAATVANTTATEAQAAATAAATTATNASSVALKLFRVALISTGIGAIVVVLGSLIAYLTSTQEGIDKITAVTRPLQAVFQSLLGVAQNLGKILFDTFSNPKKAISDLADFIKNNFVNRIKGAMDLVKNLIDLDFKAAGESAIQAVTGVDNLVGKVQKAGQETAKFLADAASKGREIDRLTKDIEKSQLAYNLAQIKVEESLDKQLLISKDTSRSFAEREAAAREIIRINKQNGEQEAKIIQMKIQQLKLQQSLNDTSREGQQEMIDLQVALDKAQGRGDDSEIEQLKVIAGARKEAAAQELERQKKISDTRINAMKTELDTYLAMQGDRKKSMEDEIGSAEIEKNKRLAIAKEEYDEKLRLAKGDNAAREQAQAEFNLESIEINNEYLATVRDATIENANLEFELFKLNNQRKLDENTFFSEELYNQELERINRVAEAEAAQRTLDFQSGVINQQEYALAIAQIDENQRIANESAANERETAKKEQEAANLAVQDELNAERFEYDLALQMERNERERTVALEDAKKTGADIEAINELYDKKAQEREQAVMNNKMELASETFGNLASILGESSAAGKAAAIAQTTIDTYLGAQKAYTSQLIPGDPTSPIRGALAAIAATAVGFKNVKAIVSTKEPKISQKKPSYAMGVIGAGTGTSDSIDARLSAGESVMTARTTAMFGAQLAAMNQAGGGVGLNGYQGSSSAMVQESLRSGADNSAMAELVADAVFRGSSAGTAVGSQKGIRDLSNDRQIAANATF